MIQATTWTRFLPERSPFDRSEGTAGDYDSQDDEDLPDDFRKCHRLPEEKNRKNENQNKNAPHEGVGVTQIRLRDGHNPAEHRNEPQRQGQENEGIEQIPEKKENFTQQGIRQGAEFPCPPLKKQLAGNGKQH